MSAPIQVSRPGLSSALGLSSSRLDLGSAERDIVRRNLITDFWSGTSLPVNIPPHRSEVRVTSIQRDMTCRSHEAVIPAGSMREEYGKCLNIRETLAVKLFSQRLGTFCRETLQFHFARMESDSDQSDEDAMPEITKMAKKKPHKDLMFHLEM